MPEHTFQNLINDIDEYIATRVHQEEQSQYDTTSHNIDGSRRSSIVSRGTMFVDWDGYGVPQVSYRNRAHEENGSGETRTGTSSSVYSSDDEALDRGFIDRYSLRTGTGFPTKENFGNQVRSAVPHRPEICRTPSALTPNYNDKNEKGITHAANPRRKPIIESYKHEGHVPPQKKKATDSHYRPRGVVGCNSVMQNRYRTQRLDPVLSRSTRHHNSTGFQVHQRSHRAINSERDVIDHVEARDLSTGLELDYDGRIMHVHRDRDRIPSSSTISEYYEIDVRQLLPGVPIRIVDKELPSLPQEKIEERKKKRERIARLVTKLINKLHCIGVLKELGKKDGSTRRTKSRPRGKSGPRSADPRRTISTRVPERNGRYSLRPIEMRSTKPSVPDEWQTGQ